MTDPTKDHSRVTPEGRAIGAQWVRMVESSTAGFTAADMATASAQGFRDGVASISANAGGPTCDMRTVVAVAVTMLYDTHPEDVCRVFDRNDLETIVSITEPLGHGRVEDIYRDAWDHVAAPPTAQAEGWRDIATAPKDGKRILVHPAIEVADAWSKAHWSAQNECWIVGGSPSGVLHTAWHPLPPSPTSAEGVEHG